MIPKTLTHGPHRLRPLGALTLATASTLLLLELSTCAIVRLGGVRVTEPLRTRERFWRGDHPDFGVWREPNATWVHETPCFRATLRTNSVGARDRERSRRSERPRVVVLGDSLFSGWGVSDEERISNRLERATGLEHLNFAMPHFGPYQHLLVYRKLAAGFDHEGVLVGIFPANDMLDLSYDGSAWLANIDADAKAEIAEYRYRPYLIRADSGYAHVFEREPILRRLLRRNSYAFNALMDAWRGLGQRRRAGTPQAAAPARGRSEFYDFDESPVTILEEVLVRLSREALGKRLVVLLLPGQMDLVRYQRVAGDALTPRLRALGLRRGFEVVSLLPVLGAAEEPWRAYFFDCDFHWNASGNEAVADFLVDSLSRSFYGPLRARGAE